MTRFFTPTSIHTMASVLSPQNTPKHDLIALPRHQDYFGPGEKDVDIDYPWFWEIAPSKQEVRLYSNLPLDIVRSIFDMAMWEDPKAVNLLLVSREVKNWSVAVKACSMLFVSELGFVRVEPLLYQHLRFSDTRRAGKLFRTYRDWKKRQHNHNHSVERGYLSLRNAKSVILYVHPPSIMPMFSEMTALERVEFWHLGVPFIFNLYPRSSKPSATSTTSEVPEDTYRYKSIRHLSLLGAYLYTSVTFRHRAFRDITHLDIYFQEDMAWGTLYHLRSLTHLALDMVECSFLPQLPPQNFESCVSRIVTVCPLTVQALIICCIDEHNENLDLLDFIRSGSEPDATDGGGTTRIPSSVASNPKDMQQIPLHHLQFLSRLALGKVDPRIVVGSAVELHNNHTFRNDVVYINYRHPVHRSSGHDGMRWDEAEQIIKRRSF
jgi:hypothetical protein